MDFHTILDSMPFDRKLSIRFGGALRNLFSHFQQCEVALLARSDAVENAIGHPTL